jgi:FkbM family methyltransferase
MEILSKIISAGDKCFDIGANMGLKTSKMLELGAYVLCVEPQVSCYNFLTEKFKNNNKVSTVNLGCGSSIRKDIIKISSHHTLSSMSEDFINQTSKERFVGFSWDSQEEIQLVTLDSLIEKYGIPHFCKLDVEGYEPEVLKGLSNPINYISLEFVPELKNKSFECIDLLLNIGKYVFNYSEGESGTFEFSEWTDKESIITYLRGKNDFKISFGDLYAKLIT